MEMGIGTGKARGREVRRGGRGGGRWIGVGREDGSEYSGNNVATIKTLGTYNSASLDYYLGMEHHHPILSIMGVHGGSIDRDIDSQIE